MTQVWDILVYVVLPLWVIAGFVDYLCHRRADIAHHNGVKENLLHWAMIAEIGLPLSLAIFFRIDALLLALMIAGLLAHEITSHFDMRLAMATRKVSPFEHQVHSFLEILPFSAFLLVGILHWPQLLALFGAGTQAADFSLGPKQLPRWGELIPPFAAFGLLTFAPYLEETWRGLMAKRRPRYDTAHSAAIRNERAS